MMVPRRAFFTRGVGIHRHRLQSFELALRRAGIEKLNLVRVSSIWPPQCKLMPARIGLDMIKPGQITHVVLADSSTDEPGRLICAGLGLAKPKRGDQYGYISEHHGYGLTHKKCSDLVEDMAATMLATTLGIEFDPDTAYDERKEVYRMSGKIVMTRSHVQTAKGNKDGLWTTVISSAVFIP
ncbi:MAG: Pyruvoyl-dependent arginine decarboxylase [Phycisphaerae bacterium]|nr:Pyruvoyl-dependent arginine decarboxylase [Phycisphaerae bacterium]